MEWPNRQGLLCFCDANDVSSGQKTSDYLASQFCKTDGCMGRLGLGKGE